jgi:hypothetical protein
MKHIAALLVGALLFASPSHAETPCDFKGVAVGNKMTPAEIMSALGVTNYKTNPERPVRKDNAPYEPGMGEIEDENIGPYCEEKLCNVPFGVAVGNNNAISVKVLVAFDDGLITEIGLLFNEMYWDEILPILDQKYGADWKVDRDLMPITNYKTKKTTVQENIRMEHITNGVNRRTNDRCQISAQKFDFIFEHHGAYGPYQSEFGIKLISKNF